MELSRASRERLEQLFEGFDSRGIRYVVLRGFTGLPTEIAGADIDVLVDSSSFDAAMEMCRMNFATAESLTRNAIDLLSLGLHHPMETIRRVVVTPGDVTSFVTRSLVTSDFTTRGYVERSFEHKRLVLDVVNHLAYTSPLDGSQIRVDPSVEELLLERRVERNWGYAPAPPDELAHLVCRGVFDYDGEFPQRYVSRCDQLVETVSANTDTDQQFRYLLTRLFYAADTRVYDLVRAGEYDSIRSSLRRYADY